ncbi:hypothetical protein Leryth_014071 [Lithospermum erythrorhizon]|nr:hypothetical protein Leryth_014071 [Lithospermum erythrorhizon]
MIPLISLVLLVSLDDGVELDDLRERAKAIAKAENERNLEVETFNLRTGNWEDITNVTKLNAPKHEHVVFTFESKIYALAAKEPYFDLGSGFPSFEFLVTSSSTESPTTWTYLPHPPVLAVNDTRYILWKEKKCLFVKVSDDAAECPVGSLWKFDLVSKKWCSNNCLSLQRLFMIDRLINFLVVWLMFQSFILRVASFIIYCSTLKIITSIMLLVGHDLRGEEVILRRWEIDLKDIFGMKVMDHFHDLAYLTWNTSLSASLFIISCYSFYVNFLCTCMFELESGEAIEQSLYESDFNPILINRKYFQLPSGIAFHSHFKL